LRKEKRKREKKRNAAHLDEKEPWFAFMDKEKGEGKGR